METLTEYTAKRIIEQNAGTYISIPPHYEGVVLLQAVLQKTSFTPKQVLNVYHGKMSIEALLLALGSVKNGKQPDKEAGIRAYTIIGLMVNNFISLETAKAMLEEELGQKLFL